MSLPLQKVSFPPSSGNPTPALSLSHSYYPECSWILFSSLKHICSFYTIRSSPVTRRILPFPSSSNSLYNSQHNAVRIHWTSKGFLMARSFLHSLLLHGLLHPAWRWATPHQRCPLMAAVQHLTNSHLWSHRLGLCSSYIMGEGWNTEVFKQFQFSSQDLEWQKDLFFYPHFIPEDFTGYLKHNHNSLVTILMT